MRQLVLDQAEIAAEYMDRESVIATLRAHERQLKEAGILRLSPLGSTARGDAGPESDVDLIAAFDNTRRISLLDMVSMELDLTEKARLQG